MKKPTLAARMTSLLGVMALSGSLLVSGAPIANAATYGKVAVNTQRMSAPTLKSTQVGWYKRGSKLALSCYQRGQSVKGHFSPWIRGGWDNLWYKVSDGRWLADVDIDTGSNNPVVRACPKTPAPTTTKPPATLNAKVDAFVKKWTRKKADFDGQWGAQCVDLFNYYNRDVVKAGHVGASYAYQLYANAPSSKYTKLGKTAVPRKGDVAVIGRNPYSPAAGHVAIVLSNTSSKSFKAFGQNILTREFPKGSPPIAYAESKAYVIGYLRPRG